VPGQVKCTGVTVMVAVTVVLPVLMAVNAAMFPVPLAGRPMEVLSFVQLKTVFASEPLKFTAVVLAPLHNVWFGGCSTSGVG